MAPEAVIFILLRTTRKADTPDPQMVWTEEEGCVCWGRGGAKGGEQSAWMSILIDR